MYKTVLWIVCLLLVSTGAMAAPRASVRDGNHICGIKQTSIPAARQLKHSDVSSMPASGGLKLDIQSNPDQLANEGIAPFTAPTQPHGKTTIVTGQVDRHPDFGAAPRNKANFATEEIPAHIKLVQHQPAAPPVVNNRSLAPSQA